ncbi:pyridoxal-phosphate dependent enzyme [uncultured Dubosiella sp.]|uniref:pyridoxal-phosphate dependent enzyme n=1 Tax=uncultured Dubosiella sp. TaxID=1937011 RepID=UPI00260DB089|nr:pyridoxal-phosphate dependent enzyme [uncultured Dubosiella sp.]
MEETFGIKLYKTPVIQIPDEVNQIYIKREDLLPFSFGGNKVRIALEFIDDMIKQGKDCLVGYGNARSNLSRALANLCYRLNIPCHIISPADEDGRRISTFNSEMVSSSKAIFHYCSKENVKDTVKSVLDKLIKEGFKPYYIYGNAYGKGNEHIPLIAYRNVYEEIKNKYNYIFLATGTGMTQGGLLAGKAINKGKEKIIGISIARSSKEEKKVIKNSLDCFSSKVQVIENCDIDVVDTYLCDGYGRYNFQIEDVIHKQFIFNGMPLDPTYTGKAFWGMQDYLKRNNIVGKKILFIHTGGLPLFFDYLKNNIKLRSVSNANAIKEAIADLEYMLTPSLTERKINLHQYTNKIIKYGKVWCHFDAEKPVSIIAGYFNDVHSKVAYLSMIAVASEYQGRKLATSLLTEFENYALNNDMECIKLEVRKHNHIAQNLYKKFGYIIVEEASEDSFYMKKIL